MKQLHVGLVLKRKAWYDKIKAHVEEWQLRELLILANRAIYLDIHLTDGKLTSSIFNMFELKKALK